MRLTAFLTLILGTGTRPSRLTSPSNPRSPQSSPLKRARAEFDAICLQITAGDERYRGRAAAEAAEKQASHRGSTGAERIAVEISLGRELAQTGPHGGSRQAALNLLRVSAQKMKETQQSLWVKTTYNLALAHLRAAEDQNCVLHHSAASCIVPISKDGIHREPDSTRDRRATC